MYEDEFLKNTIAIRKLSDGVKDGTINADEAQSQLETLTLEKRAIEQRIAQATAPRTDETRSIDFGKVREAMMEKRAITLDGTGAINQVKELAKELSQKKEILKLVRYFHGPSASTNIPVLSPGLAGP
jgi:hypothetical protein